MEWFEILAYVVGILGVVLGVAFWRRWEGVVTLLKELGEAFTKSAEALEDKKLTKEEAVALLKEWNDVVSAILILLPKSAQKFFESKK